MLKLIQALFILLPFFVFGQKAKFEFFTNEDGLAGNNTSSVTQDDQGFIWFVNDGKIHRYDGRNFLVFPHPDGISVSEEPFLGLASWQDSLLFFWSENYSFLFNPRTANWQNIKIKEERAQIEGVKLWQRLGYNNILLNRSKKGFEEVNILYFQNNQLEPVLFPSHISLLNTSYYWSDIDASLNTYLAYQDTLYKLGQLGQIKSATPLDNICTDCYNLCFQFGLDDVLILMANWQFYILDKELNEFSPHPANRFLQAEQNHLHRFILEDNGSIWACGQDRNLIYYDALRDTLYNFHDELKKLLPNLDDFKGLFKDNTGILWVDTRLGLLKVSLQTYPFDTYFNGQNQFNAYYSFRGFTEDSQGMIYGVYYDGIAKLDPVRKQPQRLYTFPEILNFFDLHTEGDSIWVNGGQFLNIESGKLMDVPSSFHENPIGDNGFFDRDKNGKLWWASHYDLYYLHRSENDLYWIKELELPEKVFHKTEALHAGSQSGKLWISFKGRLLQYDPEAKKEVWYDPFDWNFPVSHIMTIVEDNDGKLWLGTDAGLVHFDPVTRTVNQYTIHDGLPNNFICGMLTEGDSCLWLSTNHGLSRFHMPTETFVNFFEEEGLSYNEFNRKSYFKARNGRMFFGGMRGINAFFPEEIMQAYRNKGKRSQMRLTSFEYMDERQDTIIHETNFTDKPEIYLHHWDWSYTFEYVLTDYHNPKEIFYSYQMEGYKDSWSVPSKFNFTRFNNLPSGEYTFRVKARDSYGQWHPNQLSVKVVVYPPWWATWWAYSIYFLLFLAVMFITFYFINKRLLLHNQLKLQQKEAQRLKELDSFKSRLYTNLTHEFRTPLTVILGMIKQIKLNPEKNLIDGVRLIENNSKNLLRLINQLLDLSKLENKSFQLHLKQGNIVPYLRYLTESFQTFVNSKNMSLSFFTPVESLVMDYDPEQIKQVLSNLLSNAVKFTPSDGEIAVRLIVDENTLGIEVKDTGIGIAESELPYVFDRFYQVDNSATRASEGTGIGLAYTLELVKLMGGNISVKSSLGKGTSFLVVLPVRREAELLDTDAKKIETKDRNLAISSNQSSIGKEKESGVNISLPHLLIIEDNADVVTYLKSILNSRFQLDIAYNGKIGIEKALERIPDLIISDVMMPEKDGYQVCDTLKNDERTSHIPIILLTAKADAVSRLKGLRRGADVYLSKPFDEEELIVQLEMLVERQKRLAAWFSKNLRGENGVSVPDVDTKEAIQVEDAFVKKVSSIIEENYSDEDFALPQLCQKIGMSRSQLFRKMKAILNESPSGFIRSYRLNKAKLLLETTNLTVSEVAWKVGFKDLAHFSKTFQQNFGFPPSETHK